MTLLVRFHLHQNRQKVCTVWVRQHMIDWNNWNVNFMTPFQELQCAKCVLNYLSDTNEQKSCTLSRCEADRRCCWALLRLRIPTICKHSRISSPCLPECVILDSRCRDGNAPIISTRFRQAQLHNKFWRNYFVIIAPHKDVSVVTQNEIFNDAACQKAD